MLFKALRSKSSSKSTKNSSMVYRASTDAHSHTTHYTQGDTKGATATIISTPKTDDSKGSDDYQKFLEKSRKEAEREEKRKLKELKEAERRRQEVNMSPWGGRM